MILKKFFVLLTLFPASCRVTAVENAGGNALENDNNATTYTSALFSINSILGNSVDDSVSFSTRNPRHKRDLANLYFMILFGTNCNPLNYNGYGCYCGLLGSGDPVDGIDRCCQQHDMCYKDANCWTISLYIKPYIWTSYGTGAYCDYNSDECSRGLCECDAAFTRCLRQYRCPTRKRSCNQRSYWSFY